jgi:hypothetical protein
LVPIVSRIQRDPFLLVRLHTNIQLYILESYGLLVLTVERLWTNSFYLFSEIRNKSIPEGALFPSKISRRIEIISNKESTISN